MIFRRSTNTDAAKNAASQTQRNQAAPVRREPELAARSPSAVTPPNPIAAPARRPAQPSPASAYARQDQMRKLTVGRDIALNGEIATCDHLVVEGTVQATIKGGQILEIAECGAFGGVVDIENADIAGQFDGDLVVRDKLVLRATARVTGTIRYTRLQIDTGARVNGNISVLPPVAPAQQTPHFSTAPQQTQPQQMQQQTQNDTTVSTVSSNSYSLSAVMDQTAFLKASA